MASEIKVDDIKDSAGAFTQARLVDTAFVIDGEVDTGVISINNDNSIMQNDEGNPFLALPAFTPKDALNILRIDVVMNLGFTSSNQLMIGLFQDSIVDAIALVTNEISSNNQSVCISFVYQMVAGTTSPITFSVRAGAAGGATTTFNGILGTRTGGGKMVSSISVMEFKPD